uniref:RNA helicase n=1 Tax=Ciona intestinalis TaxID=7719 RepID=O96068_CIOIN|nr:DEAD-Box Protein isoform X3 [Ciona intestinalis]BAA36710.1 DEAD-Box Protein [Ciona intestinalis]|eukprot:XP_009861178.1 DEAD-Box Protein isoform X3 [Ciona intestinalis]
MFDDDWEPAPLTALGNTDFRGASSFDNPYSKKDDGGFGSGFGDSRGGARSKGCFKCGEEGHMSRECPQNTGSGFGDSRGGARSKGCFKCGEEGHMSRECPQNTGSGFGDSRGGARSKGCFKCGEEGHMSRECPQNTGSGDRHSNAYFKGGDHAAQEYHKAGDGDKPRPPLYIPPPPPEDEVEMFASMQRGINFGKYDAIPVEVSGLNAPKCISTFEMANLQETILVNVQKAGYDRPTPVQKYSIPIINADRDLMACAQTGSGKTAAFLLPVLTKLVESGVKSSEFSEKKTPQAIIIGPTRELVNQIFLEARKFSRSTIIHPVVVYGGTSVGYQIRAVQKGCDVLIATPGRLMDFINRGLIGLENVRFIILDEADRMLDMGFESEIRKLVSLPGMPQKNNRHTLMFSATFPDEIQKLAHDFLREDFLFLTVGRVGGACSDVTQTVISVEWKDKRSKLLELIADVNETKSRTLVFVETKRGADFLACVLCQEDFPTTSIHGDRLQQDREQALRDFKLAVCPILVATSVAARGLDIPKVEHVINYDMPREIDEYVHRIGRTGRCGNLGRATTFFDNKKDANLARSLVKILSEAQQEVPGWLGECAESAVGSNFGAEKGRFGGKDLRERGGEGITGFGSMGGGSGARSTADYDYNDGGGFDCVGVNDDDDSWD